MADHPLAQQAHTLPPPPAPPTTMPIGLVTLWQDHPVSNAERVWLKVCEGACQMHAPRASGGSSSSYGQAGGVGLEKRCWRKEMSSSRSVGCFSKLTHTVKLPLVLAEIKREAPTWRWVCNTSVRTAWLRSAQQCTASLNQISEPLSWLLRVHKRCWEI